MLCGQPPLPSPPAHSHPPPPSQLWPHLFFWRTSMFFISCNHSISTPPSSFRMCSLSPSPSSYPSSLCILDHFLSFQVSGPVEADDPSPGGAGPPHCLRSVSLSLCSRYAHSPHPVRVGGRGRGAGRPQGRHSGHLLQQQTLMKLLVLFTLQLTNIDTNAHTWSTYTTVQKALNRRPTHTWFYTELKPT